MEYHYTPIRMTKTNNNKTVMSASPGENTEELDQSCIVGANVKWYSGTVALDKSGTLLQNTHNILTQTSNYTLRHLSQRNKNLCSQQFYSQQLNTGNHSSAPQWVSGKIVVLSYHEIV